MMQRFIPAKPIKGNVPCEASMSYRPDVSSCSLKARWRLRNGEKLCGLHYFAMLRRADREQKSLGRS